MMTEFKFLHEPPLISQGYLNYIKWLNMIQQSPYIYHQLCIRKNFCQQKGWYGLLSGLSRSRGSAGAEVSIHAPTDPLAWVSIVWRSSEIPCFLSCSASNSFSLFYFSRSRLSQCSLAGFCLICPSACVYL